MPRCRSPAPSLFSLSPSLLSVHLSYTHTAADNAACLGFNEKSSDSRSTRLAAVWQQKWALIPQQTNKKKKDEDNEGDYNAVN